MGKTGGAHYLFLSRKRKREGAIRRYYLSVQIYKYSVKYVKRIPDIWLV